MIDLPGSGMPRRKVRFITDHECSPGITAPFGFETRVMREDQHPHGRAEVHVPSPYPSGGTISQWVPKSVIEAI